MSNGEVKYTLTILYSRTEFPVFCLLAVEVFNDINIEYLFSLNSFIIYGMFFNVLCPLTYVYIVLLSSAL